MCISSSVFRCSTSVLEDAVSARSDQASADDENDAKEDLSLDQLDDANYGQNYGDNP